MTARAFFHITARNMELAMDDAAIMTGPNLGLPVVLLVPVADAINYGAAHPYLRSALGGLDPLGPTLNHSNPAVHHETLLHRGLQGIQWPFELPNYQ